MRRSVFGILAVCAAAAVLAFSSAPTFAKTVKECDAEYSANKAAIKASGQKKADYVAACRAGTATTPAATAPAAPAATPAAAPAATPAAAPAPQPTATPAPVAPKPHVAATGAGGFATDAQARAHCPADTVVWVNTKSHVYHFAGTHNYGTTKEGTYMCEADAKAAGDRAAENEKHP
jgi:pyruvate/2-oxoglutarate dehydrogenase complex dihydrolipoamide acyltransferase (E2) component